MVVAVAASETMHSVYERHSQASAANAAQTVTVTGRRYRLMLVTCKYSAAPTQAGVTIGVDSGVAAAYDATFLTGSANAQTTVYVPPMDMVINADDGWTITAPAGGVGITSQIVVYVEVMS